MTNIENRIHTRSDLAMFLSKDLEALFFTQNVTWLEKAKNPIWKFERLLRICEYYKNVSSQCKLCKFAYVFYKYRFRRLSIKLGFSIPENVFGPGLSIAHYGSIIVNPNASIGSNCRIHVGVNIGANKDDEDVPTIGDNVYIGPGAKVFGKIIIGNNTRIGANAVVTKSCKGNCTLLGIPAQEK